MPHIATIEPTVGAYDRLAPYYDQFTAGYAHQEWIAAIEEQATELGLPGRRALDMGCGTGSSTAPLLARGYSVLACDISPEMVRIAREKFRARADSFFVADMRHLPPLGEFDLVVCLDDCINYLLTDAELEATFRSVARLLAPGGVFVFDVNSLRTYRSGFSTSMIRESDGLFFGWRGEATAELGPCETAMATVEVFAERDDGLWERRSSKHFQRHHSADAIRAALAAAGLSCCRVVGQLPGARLEATACEERHSKLVYFARHGADE
jgi:SAM-dependent methyltransferase